jgi:proton-dependent oligopeptide transporter, POT family
MINTKQPIKLYLYSLVDMWERYGFYTMHGILVLYITQVFKFHNAQAYSIFAAFAALLYLTPILGGYIADRYMGSKLAVIIGGVILSAGYALLTLPDLHFLYLGLATITMGSGLFMPNIAAMVSDLYDKDDARREGGFSIFYTAINVGAFIPPIIAAFIIEKFGWHAAFLMAAVGVLFGVSIFILSTRRLKIYCHTWKTILCVVCIFVMIYTISYLVKHTLLANIFLFTLSGLFLLYLMFKCFSFPRAQRNKLIACLILILLSIMFSILYQQAGMSLTIYTKFNVTRTFGSWTIPTVMFQSLNPFFIILLGPILAKLWNHLAQSKKNPSIAVKFGLGTCFMGLGFIVLPLAIRAHSNAGLISASWIILSYFLQTMGEMFVSPIGLSMVSELSPKKMLGLMMGMWYFATAIADALAGFVARWTTLPSGSNNPLITSPAYAHVFGWAGTASIVVGVFILFMSRYINKLI